MDFLRDLGKKLGVGKSAAGGEKKAPAPAGEEKAFKCATCGSESKGEAGACCGAERQGA